MEEQRESNEHSDERNLILVNCEHTSDNLKAAQHKVTVLINSLDIAVNANNNAAKENSSLIERISDGERRIAYAEQQLRALQQ